MNGDKVESSGDLTAKVRSFFAGDSAELTVWRDGEEITVTIVFGESPNPEEEQPEQQSKDDASSGEPGQSGQAPYGFSFDGDMEDFFRQFFGYGF